MTEDEHDSYSYYGDCLWQGKGMFAKVLSKNISVFVLWKMTD